MHEKRSTPRFKFVAKGMLQHHNQCILCRFENISMGGALVSLGDSIHEPIPSGVHCVLTLHQGDGEDSLDMAAQVVHYGFGLVGLKFVELDATLGSILADIIKRAATSCDIQP